MDLFIICLLVIGLANGAEIGKWQLPRPQREHSSLRIINGKKVPINKYPFMASLKSYGGLFGSGVIIDKRWILTSAFNVAWLDKGDIEFRVGSNKYDSGGQVLETEDVIFHENYTGSWDYDIAVVRVKPIKFNKKVAPIQMAIQGAKGGLKASVSGWGETDTSGTPTEVLLATDATVLDWQTCQKNYTTELTTRLMCTYDLKQGPCVYDFGDPLVNDDLVYGLYAGGYSCTPGTYPQLYTNVPSFYDWVKEKIAQYPE